MPNNVPVGQRFFVAKVTALFSSIPAINSTNPRNIEFIFWLNENSLFKLYKPGDPFSTLTGFVLGESYQIAANVALDLTAYLGLPAGGGGVATKETFTAQNGQKQFNTVGILPNLANMVVTRNALLQQDSYAPTRNADKQIETSEPCDAGDIIVVTTNQ
jgi:hypothetical protein